MESGLVMPSARSLGRVNVNGGIGKEKQAVKKFMAHPGGYLMSLFQAQFSQGCPRPKIRSSFSQNTKRT